MNVLAQHAVAKFIEPRNVLNVVQLADQINAVALKRFAIEYAVKNLDVVLLETPKASFDSLEEETLEDITQVLRSGDVVGGWTEAATATRSVGREPDDEIERAAKLAPRARAQPKVHEEKVDVGKPPLASQVVAKAAPRTPPSSSSRIKGSLSMFLSGELDKEHFDAERTIEQRRVIFARHPITARASGESVEIARAERGGAGADVLAVALKPGCVLSR